MSDQLERAHHDPSPMTGERLAMIRDAMKKRDEFAPKAGDEAPDFSLPRLSADGEVRLSDLRGKPVALIFGSYT